MKRITLTIIMVLILHSGFTNSQWITQNPGTGMNINAVDFVNVNTGWAAGDNSKVYRTTNGGANWIVITVPGNPVNFTHSVSKELDKMCPGAKNMIFGTTNSGANWFSTFLGTNASLGAMDEQGGNLYAAYYQFNNAVDTIISANLMRSTNNGVNWIQINTIPVNAQGDPIHGVDIKLGMKFVSNDTGYIATVRGVYKTVNAGLNFVFLPNSPSSPKSVVAGSNSLSTTTTFYVGVDKPNKLEIYNTTNGGNSWLLLSSISDPNDTKIFSAISCPANTNKIYLTISNRGSGMNPAQDTSIYYSSNSGANWYYQTLPVTNVKINSIDFADGNTGYIAGSNGTILKTTNGGSLVGIQPVSSEIPGSYNLYQNYPNPFNPETKITFSIPKAGNVSIKVYDIKGKLVQELVNSFTDAGTHELKFDGSKLASGIYFYRLDAEDPSTGSGQVFTETKKMLLVK